MMLSSIPIVPDHASSVAWQVDLLVLGYTLISIFFVILVAGAVSYFAIKYRRGSNADRSNPIAGSLKLELTWTIIPLVMAVAAFTWGAKVYFEIAHAPEGAMEITVVGRQWMWKI